MILGKEKEEKEETAIDQKKEESNWANTVYDKSNLKKSILEWR